MTKEQALKFLTGLITTPVGMVNERGGLAQEATRTPLNGRTTEKVRILGKIDAIKILRS